MIDPDIKALIDHEVLTLHLKLRRYWKAHDVRLRAIEERLGPNRPAALTPSRPGEEESEMERARR